jgi:hypothetical protein
MRRIESRIRKLEAQPQLDSQPEVRGLGCLWRRLPWERKQNLAPGERLVVDWYRNWGTMTHGRERVTQDPEDHGRACKRGGYLLDVLEELHQTCSRKATTGSCGQCVDTPVAESVPTSSSSTSEQGLIPAPAESILERHQHDELDEEDEE